MTFPGFILKLSFDLRPCPSAPGRWSFSSASPDRRSHSKSTWLLQHKHHPHRVVFVCVNNKLENDYLFSARVPTGIDALDSLLIDLTAPLLSPVDIRGPAFSCPQLLACSWSFQFPLSHEIPHQTVFCVVSLQAKKEMRWEEQEQGQMKLCLRSRAVKWRGILLLQDEILEFRGEVKDGCYVQEWDDKFCFCWTRRWGRQMRSELVQDIMFHVIIMKLLKWMQRCFYRIPHYWTTHFCIIVKHETLLKRFILDGNVTLVAVDFLTPTPDFPHSIYVNHFSQFPTEDLRRKLIFPLKHTKSEAFNQRHLLLLLRLNFDPLTRSTSAFSNSAFCFLSFSQWRSSIRKY